VRGAPIVTSTPSSVTLTSSNAPFVPADFSQPDPIENGITQLGWSKLSGFKFDIYEFYPESHAGRALLRSDDKIPEPMKAYDGKRVTISGFVLPLRTRKGQVTEFLLMRDQGTCCFGGRAQINHFIRVKIPGGIQVSGPVPWRVSGTLQVGEIYVQGYLTGIYELEAENAREAMP
jgi:hypothetical protein